MSSSDRMGSQKKNESNGGSDGLQPNGAMASNLEAMASNLLAMPSNLSDGLQPNGAMASNLMKRWPPT